MSHFPPSPLFFVYFEQMCTHKKAKSFWWMLINLVSWFKCLFFSLAHCVSGVTNPSKQSSQLEHLSVQITVWTHSYLFWMMLNSTHSSGKTHPYDTQTCYVTGRNKRLCSAGSTIHIYKAQRRRTADVETFCFCCSGNARPSSSRLPGCSRVRRSPFFIRWFKVGINRCCWVLCIRIFCHHFQLCFNGFYLGRDTGKHSRGSEWAEEHAENASISPLWCWCVLEKQYDIKL